MAKGLSKVTSELLSLDLAQVQKLTREQLKEAVRRLGATANQRLKALESSGMAGRSLAYKKLENANKTRLGLTRGKDRQALIDELYRERTFLKSRTSTRTGIREIEREIEEGVLKRGEIDIEDEEDFELTDSQWKKFWKIYNEAYENDDLRVYGSGELQTRVMQEYIKDKRHGKDFIINKLLGNQELEYVASTTETNTKEKDLWQSVRPSTDTF